MQKKFHPNKKLKLKERSINFAHSKIFAVPESIFSDNGTEFNLINIPRHTTPANFPQPNGKLERLHKEIGKLCRIHSFDPTQAVSLLQTSVKKAIFYNGLQLAPV